MSRKRLVLLTRDGLEHRYVANTLCAAVDIECILVDRRPIKANWRRAWKQGFGHFISKAARTAFLKAVRDQQSRERVLRGLFGPASEAFAFAEKVKTVDGINTNEVVALLRYAEPSAILVYGTSILTDDILTNAQDLTFNMHTGISPYYRGTACTFWPIVNGDYDMLGATVHECTSHIDGGMIFEIVHVSYRPGDDLHTLFGRAVLAGAGAYVRVVQLYLAGELQGVSQDLRLGREYRGSELTLGPELKARLRLVRRPSSPG